MCLRVTVGEDTNSCDVRPQRKRTVEKKKQDAELVSAVSLHAANARG